MSEPAAAPWTLSPWAACGVPILTPAAARQLELQLLGTDPALAWAAMNRAGAALAAAVLADLAELGGLPAQGRVLVLAGRGHNAGDALIAARHLLAHQPGLQLSVCFLFGTHALAPLAHRAWAELPADLPQLSPTPEAIAKGTEGEGWDLVLEGVFGFSHRPPLPSVVAAVLRTIHALPVRLRAAVDLPAGWAEPDAFVADTTYATGSVKHPLTELKNAGRCRYLDLGFFNPHQAPLASLPHSEDHPAAARVSLPAQTIAMASPATTVATTDTSPPVPPTDRAVVLTAQTLAPLRRGRPSACDKRTFGHLAVVGGSRRYPGAVLMSVLAALRSGVGLLTAFVPESLAPAYAARAPEAMWVGWPETPAGGLALEGWPLARALAPRFTAWLLGPGAADEPETRQLFCDLTSAASAPLVIDADALQPAVVSAGRAPRILTPHAGELARLGTAVTPAHILVSKGPRTVLHHAGWEAHAFTGGPVLARGGSGDLLAGLCGGLLAQTPTDAPGAAARGVYWHGRAADRLAQHEGQIAVQITQLLDHLAPVLREPKTAKPSPPALGVLNYACGNPPAIKGQVTPGRTFAPSLVLPPCG